MSTGTIRPYRPKPADFRAAYIRMGFGDELKEHFRTSYRILRRWVDEEGYDDLHEARRTHLQATKWPNGAPGARKRSDCFVHAAPVETSAPARPLAPAPALKPVPVQSHHFTDFPAGRPARGRFSHAKSKAVATNRAKRSARVRIARDLADAGASLPDIAVSLGLRIDTVRQYMR